MQPCINGNYMGMLTGRNSVIINRRGEGKWKEKLL